MTLRIINQTHSFILFHFMVYYFYKGGIAYARNQLVLWYPRHHVL